MAIGPFQTYQLPGVFGPSGTEIVKTDKGYAIGWTGGSVWGKPHIEGSPREIARDIIVRYGKVLDLPRNDYSLVMDDIGWYGAIHVTWKPELIVSLHKNLRISDGVNTHIFIGELTKELQPLVKLIPFV